MATYDLSQLPTAIHDAVGQLVQAVQGCLLPTAPRCPHATEAQPCCPACTVTREAESILAEVQPSDAPGDRWTAFPRQPLEQAVLEVLQTLFPLPATTLQVTSLVDTGSYRQVQTVLKALAMLGTIAHPARGYYRWRNCR